MPECPNWLDLIEALPPFPNDQQDKGQISAALKAREKLEGEIYSHFSSQPVQIPDVALLAESGFRKALMIALPVIDNPLVEALQAGGSFSVDDFTQILGKHPQPLDPAILRRNFQDKPTTTLTALKKWGKRIIPPDTFSSTLDHDLFSKLSDLDPERLVEATVFDISEPDLYRLITVNNRIHMEGGHRYQRGTQWALFSRRLFKYPNLLINLVQENGELTLITLVSATNREELPLPFHETASRVILRLIKEKKPT